MLDIETYLRYYVTIYGVHLRTAELVFPELQMPGDGREGFVPGKS